MSLSNISGIIGKSFQLGLGADNVLFNYDVKNDKALHINRPIDLDGEPFKSDYIAADDEDLVNLFTLNRSQETKMQDLMEYVDVKIKEILGGETSDPDVDVPATPGNLMMSPTIITDLVDGSNKLMGSLTAGKFVYEIIVEIAEVFHRSETKYQMAVGDEKNPERFVPWFEITEKTDTASFKIYKTLDETTQFYVYIREMDPELANPFEQKVFNTHGEYVNASFTHDASGKVCNITLRSSYVAPSEDITDTEKFPYPGNQLLDFGINFKTQKGHRYQVVESNNPALAFMESNAEVSENDGVWTRRTTITATAYEMEYYFILRRAQSDDEYMHILIYDLDGDDPEMAEKAYHVYNAISVTQEISPQPTPDDYEWREPGSEPDHEYTEVEKTTDPEISMDAGDDVRVSVKSNSEDVDVAKEMYADKTVDITYIKVQSMDTLTGVSTDHADIYGNPESEDLIDFTLTMKLKPVDSPFFVRETNNPALALVEEVNGSTPEEDESGWKLESRMELDESSDAAAMAVKYHFCLTYPEDQQNGDIVFIALYSDEGYDDIQRLYVIQNLLGISDSSVTPTDLPIASYTKLGGVIIDENSGLIVDDRGVLSIRKASPEDVKVNPNADD